MVRIGSFLYHYRNGLFPLAYCLLFIPSRSIFGSDGVALGIGLSLAVLGQLIRFASVGLVYIVRGGKNRRAYAENLVTEGMFAHCRNPLYLGNYLIIVGIGIALNSLLFLVVGGLLFTFVYYAIIRSEEDYLRSKFGSAYDAYCAAVPRIIPNLRGLGSTFGEHSMQWKRLVVKEYGSALIWIAGLATLLLVRAYRTSDLENVAGLYGILAATVVLYAIILSLKRLQLIRA